MTRRRWCKRCGEPWPDIEAFWLVIPSGTPAHIRFGGYVRRSPVYRCRACQYKPKGYLLARQEFIRKPHGCPVPACLVILPPGRLLCHGHAERPTRPMTIALLGSLTNVLKRQDYSANQATATMVA